MRFIAVLALSVFSISCSTVVRLPSSTGQMPVVGGGLLKGRAGFDLSSSVPVTVVNDITTAPPTRTTIDVGRDGNLIASLLGVGVVGGSGLDVGVGLTERIDFYLTRAAGLRWMVFGDPKGKGVKAIVFAGVGNNSSSSTTTSGGSSYSSETQMPTVEYGFSVGKSMPMTDSGILYLTMGSRGGTAKTKVTHSSGTVYTFEDQVEHYTATLGWTAGTRFYGKFELSANHIVWKGSPFGSSAQLKGSNTIGGATIGLGWHW